MEQLEIEEEIASNQRTSIDVEPEPDAPNPTNLPPLDRKALWSLLLQHLSSTWQSRSFEFGSFLFLATLFPNSLLPASIFTFFTTASAIAGSGFIGNLVDDIPRLQFVRRCILVQKLTQALAYSLFLVLFLKLRTQAASALTTSQSSVWVIFTCIVILGCALNLSTIAIQVGVERDWVTCIAGRNLDRLTKLNTYLRRIDLLSKLLAPLFVSLLTVTTSYQFCVAFLLGLAAATFIFEFLWIEVVYRRLPVLQEPERNKASEAEDVPSSPVQLSFSERLRRARMSLKPTAKQQFSDWHDFVTSSIFPSSLAISLLYLTVLSFDGTLITYLVAHSFSDAFIAGMRGVCVVTGLLGTVGMPYLEKRLGVVRTGTWSLISQIVSLVPVLISFFVGAAQEGERGPAWNAAMLFTGMALSRIGLWSFDLCQLKELQTTLQDHPRRNSITALQYSLQNAFNLLKSILTIILSRPSQFRWAALVSFISAVLGSSSYLYYVRRQRGHLLHLEWTERLLRKKK